MRTSLDTIDVICSHFDTIVPVDRLSGIRACWRLDSGYLGQLVGASDFGLLVYRSIIHEGPGCDVESQVHLEYVVRPIEHHQNQSLTSMQRTGQVTSLLTAQHVLVSPAHGSLQTFADEVAITQFNDLEFGSMNWPNHVELTAPEPFGPFNDNYSHQASESGFASGAQSPYPILDRQSSIFHDSVPGLDSFVPGSISPLPYYRALNSQRPSIHAGADRTRPLRSTRSQEW